MTLKRQKSIVRLEALLMIAEGQDYKEQISAFSDSLPGFDELPGITVLEYWKLSEGAACPRLAWSAIHDLRDELDQSEFVIIPKLREQKLRRVKKIQQLSAEAEILKQSI